VFLEILRYSFSFSNILSQYKGANIQLLDTPGIIEGASTGKGRGKQVISTTRTAVFIPPLFSTFFTYFLVQDLVLMLLDAPRAELQKKILTREMETMGIRLNKSKPDIYIKVLFFRPPLLSFQVKKAGGVQMTSTVTPLNHLNERLVRDILKEYGVYHAEVNFFIHFNHPSFCRFSFVKMLLWMSLLML
jgi:ribosome-interacting GTPase 1